MDSDEAIRWLIRRLNVLLADQLKALLEGKHIYQRVSINPNPIVKEWRGKVYPSEQDKFDRKVDLALERIQFTPASSLTDQPTQGQQHLLVRNVKVFCGECGEAEAFAPIRFEESGLGQPTTAAEGRTQLFSFTYQCQRCKSAFVGFLVRKESWYLSLDGRSPMEHIQLPKYIPKTEQPLFRDAVIAIHGGKTLAALFYLRTFIEQFARRLTGLTGKATGDEIMTAYSATLPITQRDQMPSLKEWYEKLSIALHSAKEDAELFEQAKEAIEQHFDIRRVFKIPETPRAPADASS